MKNRGKLILGIIQLFVAAGALPAGYLMLAQPDGSGLGMTTAILSGSPFKDFLIPGLFLFTVNGVFNLISSLLCLFKYKHAAIMGTLLGSALLIWVLVQVYSVGLTHILQPVYFTIALGEIILSIFIFKAEKPAMQS